MLKTYKREISQSLTLLILCIVYIGGYGYVRSSLQILLPSLTNPVSEGGLNFSNSEAGVITAFGIGGYAAGKFINGSLVDVVGAKLIFILCITLAIIINVIFSRLSNFYVMTFVWFIISYFCAPAWAAMTKVIYYWFEPERQGRAFSVISLASSFQFAIIAFNLGIFIDMGISWRMNLLYVSFIATICTLIGFFCLNTKPTGSDVPPKVALVLPELDVNVTTNEIYSVSLKVKDISIGASNLGKKEALVYFLSSFRYWVIVSQVLLMTVIYEISSFLPLYISQVLYPISDGNSSILASIFSIGAGLSVVAGGAILDHFKWTGQTVFLVLSNILLTISFAVLLICTYTDTLNIWIMAVLLFLIGISITTPYYIPSAIYCTRFGGEKYCATIAALFDGFGYLGGFFTDNLIGVLSDNYGWSIVLFIFMTFSFCATIMIFLYQYSLRVLPGGR